MLCYFSIVNIFKSIMSDPHLLNFAKKMIRLFLALDYYCSWRLWDLQDFDKHNKVKNEKISFLFYLNYCLISSY